MSQLHAIIFSIAMGIAVILGGIQSDTTLNSSMRFGSDISTDNQKACFKNIHTITSAIENYNMDVREMIKSFDNDVKEMLIDKKYLSPRMSLPTESCEYASEGDLSNDGILYCKFHGDIDNKLNLWNRSKAKADSRKHTNWSLIAFCVSIGFYLFINIGAWFLGLFFGSKVKKTNN
jgi:hypothetical protein